MRALSFDDAYNVKRSALFKKPIAKSLKVAGIDVRRREHDLSYASTSIRSGRWHGSDSLGNQTVPHAMGDDMDGFSSQLLFNCGEKLRKPRARPGDVRLVHRVPKCRSLRWPTVKRWNAFKM